MRVLVTESADSVIVDMLTRPGPTITRLEPDLDLDCRAGEPLLSQPTIRQGARGVTAPALRGFDAVIRQIA